MAIGVDTSKWKPRKLKGTPAAKFRNVLGLSIVGAGLLFGVAFHFSKYTAGIRKAVEVLYEDPVEEVERRMMIAAGLPNRTAAQIEKLLEEESRPDLPDK